MAIRVLIVDDSPVVRARFRSVLGRTDDIEVVATAKDPFAARDMIVQHDPDVILLDMEMPRMDGLTFLGHIMEQRPTPTIIVSSLTPKGCDLALRCLEAGAFNVLPKPSDAYPIEQLTADLLRDIRGAAQADMSASSSASKEPAAKVTHEGSFDDHTPKVIAIGASTGGTEALRSVLGSLPANLPGIVIVQHMPPVFTASFSARLNGECELEVREAKDGDRVRPGLALVAPGDHHMKLAGSSGNYRVEIGQGPKVCRHRPSVDVLFQSTSRVAGGDAMGAILTGMGDDGATAIGAIRDAGGYTVAQDEASCVVFGMPREAIKRGNIDEVVPLSGIGRKVVGFAQDRHKGRRAS